MSATSVLNPLREDLFRACRTELLLYANVRHDLIIEIDNTSYQQIRGTKSSGKWENIA
jgi:hypothetical protein